MVFVEGSASMAFQKKGAFAKKMSLGKLVLKASYISKSTKVCFKRSQKIHPLAYVYNGHYFICKNDQFTPFLRQLGVLWVQVDQSKLGTHPNLKSGPVGLKTEPTLSPNPTTWPGLDLG